jgi:hypothetical protein
MQSISSTYAVCRRCAAVEPCPNPVQLSLPPRAIHAVTNLFDDSSAEETLSSRMQCKRGELATPSSALVFKRAHDKRVHCDQSWQRSCRISMRQDSLASASIGRQHYEQRPLQMHKRTANGRAQREHGKRCKAGIRSMTCSASLKLNSIADRSIRGLPTFQRSYTQKL